MKIVLAKPEAIQLLRSMKEALPHLKGDSFVFRKAIDRIEYELTLRASDVPQNKNNAALPRKPHILCGKVQAKTGCQ